MLQTLSSHHTVVGMHGIAIMPPALCIVMEVRLNGLGVERE